jgi:hypothetical protein
MLQRLGGRGSPQSFLHSIQLIDTKYDAKSVVTRRLTTELNAAVEPRLRRAKRTGMMREISTEFNGISTPVLAVT